MDKNFLIRDVGLKGGFLLGVIMSLLFAIAAILQMMDSTLVTVMRNGLIVAAIVYGHHEFKRLTDKNDMSYGDGVKTGTLLVVVAYIVHSFVGFIYNRFINPNYLLSIREKLYLAIEERNAEPTQVDQMIDMVDSIFTTEGVFISGIISGVLVGLFYALIISAFTKSDVA